MLIDFFMHLRNSKLPVSLKEHLLLLEAMSKDVISPSIDEFYYLSRATLIKDERNYDKFDKAFGAYFQGVQALPGLDLDLPLEWLKRQFQREFTAEEKAAIEAMGGLDKLLARLKELLVLNWRQKAAARSSLKLAIEDVLDSGLPSAYSSGLYRQKCDAVFEHVYESYPERDAGVYAGGR